MVHQGIREYQQTTITSQSPERLIVMLYEGALRFLESARTDAAEGDLPAMGHHVGRAQKIILELQCCLDHETGGQVAANLDSLYGFVLRELTDLRIDADVRHIADVRRVLLPLLAAWRAVPPGTAEQARRPMTRAHSGPGTVVARPAESRASDSIAAQHSELCLAV